MERDALTGKIIGFGIEVHRETGPGLLESTYEECLAHELHMAGLKFSRQMALPVRYKGILLECGYRIDFLVEDSLIIELKAVERLLPIHDAQLLTYMKLSGIRKGLLMNFNIAVLKDGVKRFVL